MAKMRLYGPGIYRLDRLLTLIYSAAFGLVALAMFQRGWLALWVAPAVHLLVFACGLALLVLTLIQIICLLRPGRTSLPAENSTKPLSALSRVVNLQGRNPDWLAVRYIVLFVPFVFYLVGVPDKTAGEQRPWVMELFAREVHSLASDAQTRARYEGKTVRVQGLLVVSRNEHVFSLVPILDHRLDIEIPRPLTVVVDDSQVQDQPLDEREPDWPHLNRKLVNVLGTIQFHEPVDAPGRWDAILVVHPTKDVPVSELIKSAYADP